MVGVRKHQMFKDQKSPNGVQKIGLAPFALYYVYLVDGRLKNRIGEEWENNILICR